MRKNIRLTDRAYEAFAGLKHEGESFSDVALRLAREHRSASSGRRKSPARGRQRKP